MQVNNFTVYSGCSFVAGAGFDLEKDDPALWVNILHGKCEKLSVTEKVNVSESGSSNYQIFMQSLNAIKQLRPRYLFTSFTGLHRFHFELGFEEYSTHLPVMPNVLITTDIETNEVTYSKKYPQSFSDRLVTMLHPIDEIAELLKYIDLIKYTASFVGTKVFFINSFCPWDQQFFKRLNTNSPNQTTAYTRTILNLNNRGDDQFFRLYHKMHDLFDSKGGVQEGSWINLYESIDLNMIDKNSDGIHPGTMSNQIYTSKFLNKLNQLLA